MPYRTYLDWLSAQGVIMGDLVRKWAEINSGSTNELGLSQMAVELSQAFANTKATISTLPTASHSSASPSVLSIVQRPNAPFKVLLCGHRDTVFATDHPFQHCTLLDENTLQGPGVADMKGGLVVMLYALLALERSPWANNLGWEVLITGDEETGSLGSAPILAARAGQYQMGLVFEPALTEAGLFAGERKGSGHYTVVATGKAAHAGRNFDQGRNAIVALAALIPEIHQLNQQRQGVTINIGQIQGGVALNVVPDRALCHLDIRTTTAEDEAWFTQTFATLLASFPRAEGITLSAQGHFHRPPKPLTAKTLHLFQLLAEIGVDLDQSVSWQPTGGCCDGNNLAAAGLPTIDSLGVRGGKIHTSEEYIILPSLVERAQLTALLLMKLAAGEVVL